MSKLSSQEAFLYTVVSFIFNDINFSWIVEK